MAKWFVVDKGVKAGPFSDDAFFKHLKGKDPARIQVWRQGMSAWVPASDIPQLVELMAPSRKASPLSRGGPAGSCHAGGLGARSASL